MDGGYKIEKKDRNITIIILLHWVLPSYTSEHFITVVSNTQHNKQIIETLHEYILINIFIPINITVCINMHDRNTLGICTSTLQLHLYRILPETMSIIEYFYKNLQLLL